MRSYGKKRSIGDGLSTKLLVLSFLAVFVLQIYISVTHGTAAIERFIENYGFTESALQNEYYRFLTHIFLHGSLTHLASNSAILYIAGKPVESRIGGLKLMTVFFLSALAGSLANLFLVSSSAVAIGASAGVMGVVAVAAMLTPMSSILEQVPVLKFFSVPVLRLFFSAAILGVLVVVQEFAMATLQVYEMVDTNVGHVAHAGGIAGGLFLSYFWHPGETVQSVKFSVVLLAGLGALLLLQPFTELWYGSLIGVLLFLIYWQKVREGSNSIRF